MYRNGSKVISYRADLFSEGRQADLGTVASLESVPISLTALNHYLLHKMNKTTPRTITTITGIRTPTITAVLSLSPPEII